MRNLLLFLEKYNGFVLFIFTELLATLMIIQESNYHKVAFLNSASTVSGKIYSIYDDVAGYFKLKSANEKLAEENAYLRSQLETSMYDDRFQVDIVRSQKYEQLYTYIPAKIISNSINKVNNYITIDKGTKHNISEGMGVIGTDGIVGIVVSSSKHYSSIMSVLHKSMKISALVRKNGYFGTLTWHGQKPDLFALNDIPKHTSLSIGDTITTSGYSSIFPEGIIIGTIESFEVIKGSNFYSINVKSAINFNNIRYVYVVNHLQKGELSNIEQNTINE